MQNLIQEYLDCLERADYDKLINLFEPDAIVYSPLYGKKDAKEFYRKLFEDTTQSKIKLINIFTDEVNKSAAAYFHYDWTLSNNTSAPFDVVDIFELNDTFDKIINLRIIYDTWQTREKFNDLSPSGYAIS
ncbi:MAG: nuclear transport factor 2 family protein [Legionellales bacterium]|jgi:hypothetical protein